MHYYIIIPVELYHHHTVHHNVVLLHWDSCCTVWYWFVRLVFVCNNQVVLYKLILVAICVYWYLFLLKMISSYYCYSCILKIFYSFSVVHNINIIYILFIIWTLFIQFSRQYYQYCLIVLFLITPLSSSLLIIVIVRILYVFRSISYFDRDVAVSL